ncbi:MAG: hypothetical protein ABI275_05760 [Terrimesophilobacter sp.]
MNVNPLGSSAVLVLAAVLWFVYLIPTWLRRREYLATERNAVRLQQTLRIMAETAQVPREVHAESTARSVAAQQRILRKEQQVEHVISKAQEELATRAAARRLAEARPMIRAVARTSPDAARRLRRSRAATSLVLLAALAAAVTGIAPALAGSGALLVTGLIVSAVLLAVLQQMARVARSRRQLARSLSTTPVVRTRQIHIEQPQQEEAAHSGWMPVPLPKPLYLSAPSVVPEARLAAAFPEEARQGRLEGRERDLLELREATAKAEQALREAQIAANVTPIIRAEADAPALSRFARMGMVDELDASVTDLDAVLRRRRAV